MVVKNLYNKYSFWSFNRNLNFVEKELNRENIPAAEFEQAFDKMYINTLRLNNFFNKYFSYLISHRTIFTMAYTYSNGIKLLKQIFKNQVQYTNLIDKGQWNELAEAIKNSKNIKKENLQNQLQLIKNLEKIYQFTLKKIPYNCVLNAKYIHHHGELLNVLVFIHITQREKPEVITKFFHDGCLHLSIYKTYTKFLFYKSVHPQSSMDMDIYNDNTKGNLLKKFINF